MIRSPPAYLKADIPLTEMTVSKSKEILRHKSGENMVNFCVFDNLGL